MNNFVHLSHVDSSWKHYYHVHLVFHLSCSSQRDYPFTATPYNALDVSMAHEKLIETISRFHVAMSLPSLCRDEIWAKYWQFFEQKSLYELQVMQRLKHGGSILHPLFVKNMELAFIVKNKQKLEKTLVRHSTTSSKARVKI